MIGFVAFPRPRATTLCPLGHSLRCIESWKARRVLLSTMPVSFADNTNIISISYLVATNGPYNFKFLYTAVSRKAPNKISGRTEHTVGLSVRRLEGPSLVGWQSRRSASRDRCWAEWRWCHVQTPRHNIHTLIWHCDPIRHSLQWPMLPPASSNVTVKMQQCLRENIMKAPRGITGTPKDIDLQWIGAIVAPRFCMTYVVRLKS